MRLSTIALANLRRRKGRTGFLILGFAIGIGTVLALYSLTTAIRDEIGRQLDQYGANIVVVPKANTLALEYGGISVLGVSFDVGHLTMADIQKIKAIPYKNRLSTVAPKLLGAASVGGHDYLLAGVLFPEELRMKQWWQIIGRTPSDFDEVILGFEAARQLNVIAAPLTPSHSGHGDHAAHAATAVAEPGSRRSTFHIAGQAFRIAGVLAETGGRDDQMIFADLKRVQEITRKPQEVSLIEVSALCKDCPIDDIVAQIQQQLPNAKVSAIQQAVRARTATVERLTRFSTAIAIIVLVIGGLMVTSTLTASVLERTREIGVLRAVGYRKGHIVRMLLIEVSIISLAGGLLGWLAGMAASMIAIPHFTDSGMGASWRPGLAAVAMVLALTLGLLGAVIPARRAAALEPTEALRYV